MIAWARSSSSGSRLPGCRRSARRTVRTRSDSPRWRERITKIRAGRTPMESFADHLLLADRSTRDQMRWTRMELANTPDDQVWFQARPVAHGDRERCASIWRLCPAERVESAPQRRQVRGARHSRRLRRWHPVVQERTGHARHLATRGPGARSLGNGSPVTRAGSKGARPVLVASGLRPRGSAISFRLGRQAIRHARRPAQPRHVLLRVVPAHARHLMTIRLRKAGVPPRIATTVVVAT